ncbi:MAG: GNAT family N-acetyltransferase [Bacteroidota bacterium]
MKITTSEEVVCTELKAITELLQQAFSDYPSGKTYTKQVPSFRVLTFDKEEKLIGHIAVHYRLMALGNQPIKVFGLSDVCVEASVRNQGLAKRMVNYLVGIAITYDIDYLVLVAWETMVYESLGFQICNNPCRWLIMQNNQSLGLAQRHSPEGLMVKSIGSKKWNNDLLDFLGPIF